MIAPALSAFAALLALGAVKSSSTAIGVQALAVLILPAVSGETEPKEPKLDGATLAAFSESFAEAAGGVFRWRRFEVRSTSEDEVCRSEACARELGLRLGATHVVFARLTRLRDASCAAFASVQDLLQSERSRSLKEMVAPCSADNVLSAAMDLGRRIAEGPRAPVRVTVELTPLQLRALDIPDIPDLSNDQTSTSTRARRNNLTAERALEIYKAQHMFVFDDEEQPGRFFIARNSRLLNECELRRAATAPITPSMQEFCEGNSWEWAWAAFPFGLAIAAYGAETRDGTTMSLLGTAIALGSAAIAIFLNVDAVDPRDGVHYSSREVLEGIIAKSNRELRFVLDLSDAEVAIAGMRR